MTTKYTYELTDFPNQKFDLSALQYEIEHSSITTALDYDAGLSGNGSTGVAINFKDDLSGQITLLNAIVSGHLGNALTPTPDTINISQTDDQGNILVSTQPRVGTGVTLITHNFADKKSWYSNSTRVSSGVLTCSGEAYTHYNFSGEVVDMENGRVTFEGRIVNKSQNNESYVPKIQVNGGLVTTGYTINYNTNQVVFTTPLTVNDVVTSTYYQVNDSTFVVKPDDGKQLVMEHVEVQFSKNVNFASKELWFDIYAYNPNDPAGAKIRASSPVRYKNVKDFINESNNSLGATIPVIGELTKECYIFVWQYPAARILKSSQGVEIRLFTYDPVTGSKKDIYSSLDNAQIEVATATFYCLSEPEV